MIFMPKFLAPETNVPPHQIIDFEARLLREKSRSGLSDRLSGLAPIADKRVYTDRLENELRIIEDKQVCGYFLIVADYVNWATINHIAVGPGRGSGPCSLVAFALGITKVDPIKYQLPFERFLNPEKSSPPDFDLEFCNERQAEVLNYIRSKYGTDHVAHISDDDATPLPSRLVIGDRPLATVIQLHAQSETELPATKLTSKQISDAGLIKFNVINQNALSLIQNNVKTLGESGHAISIDSIPLNDDPTYKLLSTGFASNISILDSDNYRSALIAVQPQLFSELCAVIAMHQPPHQKILPTYVKHKNNHKFSDYEHPVLRSITKETYGLVLYQEQIMHLAHEIAGMSLGAGDLLRRALQKPDLNQIKHFESLFIRGAVISGTQPSEASRIFELMTDAGKYCYNKSHAVAYAMIAYQTAWLKTKTDNSQSI